MREAGLQGRHPPRSRVTTLAGGRPIDAPDLLGQDFTAAVPDTRWCGDISAIATVDGWVYLATVVAGVAVETVHPPTRRGGPARARRRSSG